MMVPKKTSWPAAIVLIYIVFMVGVLGAVFYTAENNVDLVSDNYYEKTLVFENQIQAANNVKALAEKPNVGILKNEEQIIIKMPLVFRNDGIEGEIIFFRPADSGLDFKTKMAFNSDNIQFIPLKNMSSGKWKVILHWNDGHKEFYFENVIYI